MKYLFFDIECAGVSKNFAKICAFGYCLTDEKFNILDKRDILINPKGSFHLTDGKGVQGIVLPYEYKEFKKYPAFPEAANEIYALLQDKDTVVVGHATMNDVKYLNLESKRFSLPSFKFRFADTQFIYMTAIGDFSRQFGLGTIAERLGVEFTPHRAVDDAYATMRIAEAMCKEAGVSLVELFEKYEITLGEIDGYEITQSTSEAFKRHVEESARRKEERTKRQVDFHIFVDREKRKRSKTGKLKGKTVCFSHPIEQETELAKSLARRAIFEGAFVIFRAEECNVYVCFEGETGARIKSVTDRNGKVYTVDEFTAFLDETKGAGL